MCEARYGMVCEDLKRMQIAIELGLQGRGTGGKGMSQ
jgi:hypothetical protein